MSQEHDGRLTLRCSICGNNWPFYKPFMECPLCEEATGALRFTSAEDILTLDEANEILRDHGIRIVPRSAAKTKAQQEARVAELYDDMERWNHGEVPAWMT